MMAIIDPDGLFHGDRLSRCSDAAKLHWPRLYVASDGFGRLELSYSRLVPKCYGNFSEIIPKSFLNSIFTEYQEHFLLFVWEVEGKFWGQWSTNPKFLPRFKTAMDKRSPIPPKDEYEAWISSYRNGTKGTSEILRKYCEIFPSGVGVGIGVGVGVGVGNTPLPPKGEQPPPASESFIFPPPWVSSIKKNGGKSRVIVSPPDEQFNAYVKIFEAAGRVVAGSRLRSSRREWNKLGAESREKAFLHAAQIAQERAPEFMPYPTAHLEKRDWDHAPARTLAVVAQDPWERKKAAQDKALDEALEREFNRVANHQS